MYLIGLLLIILGILGDILFPVFVGSMHLKLSLCTLYLFFSVFRFNLKYVIILLFLYVFVAYPFTSLGFLSVFFSHLIVLVLIFKLREQIYTESYLVKAIWVMALSIAQMILLSIINFKDYSIAMIPSSLYQFIIQAMANAVLSIPLFLLWDFLFDSLGIQNEYDNKKVHESLLN